MFHLKLVVCGDSFFKLYQNSFANDFVCESLRTGVIMPLLKGKGTEGTIKDDYRGIVLFPTLCKVYEVVLFNRLQNCAANYF